jgi:hypothetical protein
MRARAGWGGEEFGCNHEVTKARRGRIRRVATDAAQMSTDKKLISIEFI